MAVDNISYNGVEDSVAQEFQPFVIDGTSFSERMEMDLCSKAC